MKRRNFILSTLAATPVLISAENIHTKKKKGQPFVVKAGEARFGVHTPYRGLNPNDLKVSKHDTDGGIAMFEYVGNEKIGPPLHIHFNQDETFYVVEGEYLFQVGDEQHTLKSGDSIFLPRNIPHTWLQKSDKGKLVYWVNPAGKMEDFFLKMNSLTQAPTPEEAQAIHLAHDMKVLGPPLG